MSTKILGVYRITFDNGVSQIKNLISHDDFLNVYKVTQDKIYDLEKENKFKPTNITKKLKSDLIEYFGAEWFTDKSPIFKAIKKGHIAVDGYGKAWGLGPELGVTTMYYKCKVEKI